MRWKWSSVSRQWRDYATPERRTGWQLARRGFLWASEPSFVTGRKPDFLTYGRGQMWVEVKALAPPVSRALLDSSHNELKKRLEKVGGNYAVDAWINAFFDQAAAKRTVQILRHALQTALDVEEELYIVIPTGHVEKETVSVRWISRTGCRVRMLSPRVPSRRYPAPSAAELDDWTQEVQLEDGIEATAHPGFEILSLDQGYKLICRVTPTDTRIGLASIGNSEMSEVTTVERLRSAIDDAADQLKSGQASRKRPGVVVVYNDHLGADSSDLLRACWGDITVPIDLKEGTPGPPFHGKNGILRGGKNSSVSGVIYRSRVFPTVSLLNPTAALPVPHRWLEGTVYSVGQDGKILASLSDR